METHESRAVWVAWAIIIALIGTISSFVGPNLIQAVILKTGNTLYIDTPVITNILFFIGMVFLVLFCIMMYVNRKWSIVTAIVFLVTSVGLVVISSSHYSIITKQKIVESPLLSSKKITYSWEQVESAYMLFEDMETGVGTLVFQFKDGRKMKFVRNKYLLNNIGIIRGILSENGVDYTNKYINP